MKLILIIMGLLFILLVGGYGQPKQPQHVNVVSHPNQGVNK